MDKLAVQGEKSTKGPARSEPHEHATICLLFSHVLRFSSGRLARLMDGRVNVGGVPLGYFCRLDSGIRLLNIRGIHTTCSTRKPPSLPFRSPEERSPPVRAGQQISRLLLRTTEHEWAGEESLLGQQFLFRTMLTSFLTQHVPGCSNQGREDSSVGFIADTWCAQGYA